MNTPDPEVDGHPTTIHVVPIRHGENDLDFEGVATLFVTTQIELRLNDWQLRAQFGFTSAESAMAIALAHGDTLSHHAGARKVSLSTVRSQLKAVLRKLGVKRQADAVRVLLGSALPIMRS